MWSNATKEQRRRLRELAAIAHERELTREFALLESEFLRWRSGDIDAHELSDRIHRFHQGPARELYLLYSGGNQDMAVAGAIIKCILSEEEAGPEIIELLRPAIDFGRRGADS